MSTDKTFHKYYTEQQAELLLDTIKDTSDFIRSEEVSYNDRGKRIKIIHIFTDRDTIVNPYGIEMVRSDNGNFYILPIDEELASKYEDGGMFYSKTPFVLGDEPQSWLIKRPNLKGQYAYIFYNPNDFLKPYGIYIGNGTSEIFDTFDEAQKYLSDEGFDLRLNVIQEQYISKKELKSNQQERIDSFIAYVSDTYFGNKEFQTSSLEVYDYASTFLLSPVQVSAILNKYQLKSPKKELEMDDEMKEFYDSEEYAKGGQVRPKSALARDRKYTSDEPHELAYRFKRKSKVQRYNTPSNYADGGETSPVKSLIYDVFRDSAVDIVKSGESTYHVYMQKDATIDEAKRVLARTKDVNFNGILMQNPFKIKGYKKDSKGVYAIVHSDIKEFAKGGSTDLDGKIESLEAVIKSDMVGDSVKAKAKIKLAELKAEREASKVVKEVKKEVKKVEEKVEDKPKTTRKPRAKTTTSTGKKRGKPNNVMAEAQALAKKIRKDGESHKDAFKRAFAELKKGTKTVASTPAKKKPVTSTRRKKATETKATPKKKAVTSKRRKAKFTEVSQTKRGKEMDAKRQALPAGKRVSKEGNVYYENRSNRSDKFQPKKGVTSKRRRLL